MKNILVISISYLISFQLFSQTIYNQKWKENTFFSVPHSFTQKVKTDELVIYEHTEKLASLEIKEWTLSDKAETEEALNDLAEKVMQSRNYSDSEIVSNEFLFEDDPEGPFLATHTIIKQKGKRTILTTLYSHKTDKNYIVLVEADSRYFKDNLNLVRQLSEGLMEL